MPTIAALVGDQFEDSEYELPVMAFKEAGHSVIDIGKEAGEKIKGRENRMKLITDRAAAESAVDDIDALFIPGGFSPDLLRADDGVVGFIRRFAATGKPILVLSRGPQLLVSADAVRGRKIAAWKSLRQDLGNAGAEYLDQEVVRDGSMVSSRGPGDLPAFISASLALLGEIYAVR